MLPLVPFAAPCGSGELIAAGVPGADIPGVGKSSVMTASPPSTSSSSAFLAFLLLPSFMPEPLNAGAFKDDGAGDDVR